MRQREAVAFWLALGTLGAVAALAYVSIDGTARTLDRVARTHEVMRQLDELSGAYARSASARRAYVVAGDASQLGELERLDARLDSIMIALQSLLADNPAQKQQLETFAGLVRQRLAMLDTLRAQRRAGGTTSENAEGLVLVTKVREAREALEHEENRLLETRVAHTRDDVERIKLVVVIGTGVSLLILLVAFGRLRQEVGRRSRSEDALRRANAFLDSIVENIPDMVFVKEESELRFERINRAGEELLSLARRDLLGKNDFDFFSKEQAEFFQALDRKALGSGMVIDIPEETIAAAGGERWLHTKKVPIVDDKGTPQFLLGISEDITERKLAAEALRAAKEAAESASQELEAFSYSVAHDLRAPLRSIDGFSASLQQNLTGKLDADHLADLKRVRSAAQHMGRIIDGLLSLSRVTRTELVREKVDLGELARATAARLRDSQPARQVELVVQDNLIVDGDPRLLAALLDNLIGNAWKFTGNVPAARVEVGMQLEDERPVFFVRDNGAGFDAAYVHKLFGAFQRLHTSDQFEGSGIGLATVQRIVRRHGGQIRAEGEVGRGATFYFSLT